MKLSTLSLHNTYQRARLHLKFSVIARLSKGIVSLCIGVFIIGIFAGHLIDFESNFYFVRYVLSQITIDPWFRGTHDLVWLTISSPTTHFIFYCVMILGEMIAGLFCTSGAYLILKNASSAKKDFYLGKSLFLLGGMIAIIVLYFSFCVIGSEWFTIWTSTEWNSQMTIYAFSTSILLAMGYILIPDPEEKA
mgnify:CR=1 FL=1